MKIFGMEKISLVDYDGYCACTLFTGTCPFRCPYCHNATLLDGGGEAVSEAEIFAHLEKRRNVLGALVISGGEPTAERDLPDFIRRIKSAFPLKIKLDTNGTNPEMLARLIVDKLLDYVAMDIKSSFENYDLAVGIDGYDSAAVARSIAVLKQGGVDYEFRTTLVDELHSRRDIEKMAEIAVGAPRYYLQKFVDSGGCIAQGLHAVPLETAHEYLEIIKKSVPTAELRNY